MDIGRRIKPAHLELVLKIEETQQLQLAAQAVAISQPAASRVLSQIEANVGSPLFTRTPKGMEVTPAGASFVRHARVILAEVRTLEHELRHLQTGDLGEVRIGAVTGPAVGCLMPALQAVLRESPDLKVNVDVAPSSVLVRRLEESKYDLVLGRIPPGHDGRDFHLHPARVEVVALMVHQSHYLANNEIVDLSELSAYPWVMQELGSPIRQAVADAFRSQGIPTPPRVLNSSSLLVALAQIAGGEAIAPQTSEVKELLVQSGISANLTALKLRHPIVVPPYFVITDRNRKLPRAAKRILQEVLARL